MGLNVKAYRGFSAFRAEVPNPEQAMAVACHMIQDGRHFYAEPQCFDKWEFCVDAEHEIALKAFIAGIAAAALTKEN